MPCRANPAMNIIRATRAAMRNKAVTTKGKPLTTLFKTSQPVIFSI
jgi:hypothetical protein